MPASRVDPISSPASVEAAASCSFAGVENVSSSKLESDEVGDEMQKEGSDDGPARRLSFDVPTGMVERALMCQCFVVKLAYALQKGFVPSIECDWEYSMV